MTDCFEFWLPTKPKSFQRKATTRSKDDWKKYIADAANKSLKANQSLLGENLGWPIFNNKKLHLTLVWLSKEWNKNIDPDVDNIIKPIQDALQGLVYEDDCWIFDVESHLRITTTTAFDLDRLPKMIQIALAEMTRLNLRDCIYIRVSHVKDLEDYF